MSKTIKIIIFFAGVALLVTEFFTMDYSDFWAWRNFKGLSVPVLIIVIMIGAIMKSRSNEDNSNNQ